MWNRSFRTPALAFALAIVISLAASGTHPAEGGKPKPAVSTATAPRKVLVELYTSQGCNSCPAASDLLGRLTRTGLGADRIVPINLHVDYFNDPWVDPHSDPEFSRRQLSYNDALGREDLYFTPLMIVDGRAPLLGSDRPKVLATLERARKEPPRVALALGLTPDATGAGRTLKVDVAARSRELTGRDLIVGVALTEDRVTTRVASGENAGRTLVEYHVVRRLDRKTTRLDAAGATSLTFSLALAAGGVAERTRVAVFVQDRQSGRVHQADSIPWSATGASGSRAAQ
jgi:hypothetical protein